MIILRFVCVQCRTNEVSVSIGNIENQPFSVGERIERCQTEGIK